MEYLKSYRNPKNEQENILVTWEKGYKELNVIYRNQLIGSVNNVRDLLKGVQFDHQFLGKIEVKLRKDPYFVEVIVDSYHSPDNLHYPLLKVRSVQSFFLPFLAINLIASVINISLYFSGSIISLENKFFLMFFAIPTAMTLAGITLLRFNKWYGYIVNLISALAQFLVPLVLFFITFYPEFLTLVILYGIQIGVALIPCKRVMEAYRHARLKKRTHHETIDH